MFKNLNLNSINHAITIGFYLHCTVGYHVKNVLFFSQVVSSRVVIGKSCFFLPKYNFVSQVVGSINYSTQFLGYESL